MIFALIFDLDGTLLETEELKAMSYARAARELDSNVDEDAVVAAFAEGLVGRSRQEVAEVLVRRFGLEETARSRMAEFGVDEPWQVLVEIRLGHYEALLEDTDLLFRQRYPHNIALLRELRGEGYPTACATMSHLEQVLRVLSVLDLEDAFDLVATMEDVERGKPDPEIDLFVARKMDLPAEEFLVIEDSPAGVKAALAAGMAVVAVTTEFTRQAFQNSELLDRRWIVDDPGDVQGVVRERIEAAGGRRRQTTPS